ncbi:hypothetical protein AVEN_105828-1 [Araneus ventricosus]|uniref:Uncharacterized protein n=1 Tax=Araneus ventricosus TaxID=182803 RepID=A0A4Y2M5K9_ARAVE|nr:hypothetical protein AVEN_105828-1 [Araneus ventricosus]
MTDSSHVWTPDLGDKFGDFGDEISDLKGIFSIFLLAEEIRLNVLDGSMWRHGLPRETIKGQRLDDEWMLIDWDRLGAQAFLEFYPLCELVSC